MTPFITVCSYLSMLALAMLIFFIFLFRFYRLRGKDYRTVGFFMVVCGVVFFLGVILIGIFYRP
ncbi:MAG: hypothetical protein PHC80_02255 [Eubacteriales bacterium]|nr:hypothetical protein [Eubacteriales bacterium]